jgi:hypothetical protein
MEIGHFQLGILRHLGEVILHRLAGLGQIDIRPFLLAARHLHEIFDVCFGVPISMWELMGSRP